MGFGHTLRWLHDSGVHDIAINLHHLADQVEASVELDEFFAFGFGALFTGREVFLAGAFGDVDEDDPVVFAGGVHGIERLPEVGGVLLAVLLNKLGVGLTDSEMLR